MNVFETYKDLLKEFGPQHWWPKHKGKKRPGFDPQFEIIVGAVLTQNTAWKNVEKAIECLYEKNLLDAESITAAPIKKLETCIRSSGYYRQKAKKLKIIAKFFLKQNAAVVRGECHSPLRRRPPSRHELLALWGLGRETADSILLYAFNQPIFVVDTYTRRLLKANGQNKLAEADYDKIRKFFESQLPGDYKLFNEYHALIVRWGKYAQEKKRKIRTSR